MTWQWSVSADRYRDSVTGRFLGKAEALGFVDQSLAATGNVTDTLASFVAGDVPAISPDDWRSAMRREIKDEYIRQYLIGRGGIEQMTPADWGSIGGALAEQYRHFEGFYEQVKADELSEGQVIARSRMYINSAREVYERGNARAQGVPVGELPAFPGDGSTICLTNDKCNWRYEQVFDEQGVLVAWNCYWTLNPAEHCETCLERDELWNPFVIEV